MHIHVLIPSHSFFLSIVAYLSLPGFETIWAILDLQVHCSVILIFFHSIIILFLFNILGMIWLNETKFCKHIIIDKNYSMYFVVVKWQFSLICNRVKTALHLCQNLVFALISWERKDRMRPNNVYTLSLTRSTFGIVHCRFSQICNRVTALYWHQN